MPRPVDEVPSELQAEWRPFRPLLPAPGIERLARALARDDAERVAALEDELGWARAQEPLPLEFAATTAVLRDLLNLGWEVQSRGRDVYVRPHEADGGRATKEAVRRQLLFGRSDQFASKPVREFICDMETSPAASSSRTVLPLIADGPSLASRLRPVARLPREERAEALRGCCRPYLQLVEPGEQDRFTRLPLVDIWRYFRYYWSSRYRRSPGRSMQYLIRDAAQPNHPVMGLTALSNTVLQLTPRDEWLGWTVEGLLSLIEQGELTDDEALAALRARVSNDLASIHAEDLGFDGANPPAFTPALAEHLAAIRGKALEARAEGLRAGVDAEARASDLSPEGLLRAARTPLFVAKRSTAAKMLLEVLDVLAAVRAPLATALRAPEAARAVAMALRQVKQWFGAGAIMDLSTCGAAPPYGPLLGGKLAALMMLSPSVRRVYGRRYEGEPSLIASRMAGRKVAKATPLVLLGTTSLYPERSSQYNRVRLPAGVCGNDAPVPFLEVGRSRGHGASNLSVEAEEYLAALAEQRKSFSNVNFVFGEGQSPKMRLLREGLAALGLTAADLVRHASPRIIYLAPLTKNARRQLLGVDPIPAGAGEADASDDEAIAEFWRARWLASRLDHEECLRSLEASPRHQLRLSAQLPAAPVAMQLSLFDNLPPSL
ncbi:MAG TPA: Druantia anti-phage system protein DruA [Polyangiaceae bacterium]|nr:Druantia anti-phage system protein DruA [Polyangiaceae bacterium]